MHRRWLNRALIALAVPALTVPALASSATAAATAKVPTIDAVAKIYPHLDGGTATESAAKVYGPGKKCKHRQADQGRERRSASYSPDYTSGDPDAYVITGARPSVFASRRASSRRPRPRSSTSTATRRTPRSCPGGDPGGGGPAAAPAARSARAR